MKYFNPVRRGFYPDPSVVRAGEDFYMVNSSFQYFPAIPVSHSRDLVRWETVGYAISNPEYLDLSDIWDSRGIWAPDIFYDEKEGKFYVIATFRRNDWERPARVQLLMSSKRPEGPYSRPIVLDSDNIDPSLFFDEDGKKYMIIAKGANAYELDEKCEKIIRGPRTVWAGTGERCSEGPHVMKHGGYYYAIVAEGGTGYGHGINVARSKELFGEYELCPYNPVMRQKDREKSIQRTGHGKLVEDQKGNWWALYLCGRRNMGDYTTLGRETALDPVTWTEDGWFLINGGKGPGEEQTAPDLPFFEGEPKDFYDDFDEEKIGLRWEFVRNPDYGFISLNGERKSHLRLYTAPGNMYEVGAKNILVHRESELCYTAETVMEFFPKEGTRAGMTCYYSTATYIRFNLTKRDGKTLLELVINRNRGEERVAEREIPEGRIFLRIETRYQTRRFLFGTDGGNYTELGEVTPCTFLCDEGVPGDRKRHTGTMVGIFAHSDGPKIPSDFDWFKINFEE